MKKMYINPQTEQSVVELSENLLKVGSPCDTGSLHPTAPARSAEMALPVNTNGMPQLM